MRAFVKDGGVVGVSNFGKFGLSAFFHRQKSFEGKFVQGKSAFEEGRNEGSSSW